MAKNITETININSTRFWRWEALLLHRLPFN